MGKQAMKPLYVLLAMVLWSAVSVGIAALARKGMGKGAAEFFIGGRRLKGFVSGMTYAATTYSAFMLVGLVGLTYQSGVGTLGFEMTYLIFTVLFLLVFGPRFWLVGRRFQHITPPELLAHRYENRWVAVLTALLSLFMLIPYASVQLMGAGLLVSGLTGGQIPFMTGVLVMAGLSGFCALWAGMRSVSWTDAFQAVTMLLTSVAALFYMFYAFYGSPGEFFVTVQTENPDLLRFTWEPAYFIGLTLPWAFFALTNPQVSQRLFVPGRVVDLRRMILYFSAFGFIYTIISTLFGLQAANLLPGLENPDLAMPLLLSRVPPLLGLILFVGIFAAATSTLGSIILTLGSLFSRDVVKHFKPDLSEQGETWAGKVGVLALLAICIYFAWLRPGLIVVLSSMASGGLLVMAPAIIGAFFWARASAAGALWSMLVGGIVTAWMYLAKHYPLGWWPPVWGLGITTLLFLGISLLTHPPRNAAQFISDVEEELVKEGFSSRK
jgi:solute:Na+ symporter, SSS family